MKNTLLITLEFPPQIGGISAYYSNICNHIPHKHLVVIAPAHHSSDEFDARQSYRIYRKKMVSENPYIWPKWLGLAKDVKDIVEKEKIQNILVGQILPIGTIAYLMKLRKNIPYFLFSHGMDVSMLSGRKKMLAKKIIKESKGVFVNSNFTKHLIEDLGYPHRHITTVYPCPQALPSPNDFEILKMRNSLELHNKKILLTVGRLVERKGHDKVIISLMHVLKKYKNLIYIIAGEGYYRKNLESLVKKYSLEENVIFLGKLSDSEISALYEMSDIFIMTARQLMNKDVEGFGTVYLEANSYGKPVIAGKSGGVGEAVINGKNGILVDPLSTHEISRAILELLDRPDYAHRLGFQGMDRVHSQFQWHNQAQKVIDSIF